ncbi:MAG: hypothetical protein N3A01_03750 [Bacteroidales bacterium]|nr:hypothetical protein [Bacteroidales bacterium]
MVKPIVDVLCIPLLKQNKMNFQIKFFFNNTIDPNNSENINNSSRKYNKTLFFIGISSSTSGLIGVNREWNYKCFCYLKKLKLYSKYKLNMLTKHSYLMCNILMKCT